MKSFSKAAGLDRLRTVLVRGFYASSIVKNRYLDIGDWFGRSVHAVVHKDSRSTAAVLIYEIVEKLLCDYHGISSDEVDADDKAVLEGRIPHNSVCYIKQHMVAERIEKIFCEAVGLDWDKHSRNVERAYNEQAKLLKVKVPNEKSID